MEKKIWFRIKDELKILLMMSFGAFLFGTLLCFIIVRFVPDPEITTASIASFMATFFGAITVSVGGAVSMISDFNIAVGMGYTRKKFVLEEIIMAFLESIVFYVISYVLYKLDIFILQVGYSDIPMDKELDMNVIMGGLLKPMNVLLLIIILVTVRFGIGILIQTMGGKAWFICYAVIMFFCLGIPRMSHMPSLESYFLEIEKAFTISAQHLNGQFWQCMGVLLCVILMTISCRVYSKLSVKA